MLEVGDTAPGFELPGAAAGRIDTHTLAEYTRRSRAVTNHNSPAEPGVPASAAR